MKIRILGILGGIALPLSAGSVYVFSVVMLLMFGFMLPGLAKAGSSGRPLSSLAGTYSYTALHGSFGYCLESPSFTVEVSCTNSEAVAFPLATSNVGQGTRDRKGQSCTTISETISDLTPGTAATDVLQTYEVATITSYDPTTQSGDQSFIAYSSGKCVGAKFESSGTPVIAATGTYHFVLSANGTRLDWEITSLTDPVGGLADFVASGTDLQQ